MDRDWDAEERAHNVAVADAFDRMVALRQVMGAGISWPGHAGPEIPSAGPPGFAEAVAAHEMAMDARDAFLDDRRANDWSWRDG